MEDALQQLIEVYGDDLYRFCCRLTMDRTDADDLYQDTFLTALEQRTRLMTGQEPDSGQTGYNRKNRNFLMGIASNLWRNQWRKKKRERKNISLERAEEQNLWLPDSGSRNMESDLEYREIQQRLTFHIDALPEKLKPVIYLFYAAGMSVEEIANILHIPRGTVKSRLHLARTRLKKSLEADGYEI